MNVDGILLELKTTGIREAGRGKKKEQENTIIISQGEYSPMNIDRKITTVVAAVIRDGNKIFATQRAYGEFKGFWEFPGGKLEDGETLQEALAREVREELDVEIIVGDLIDIIEYDYPKFHLSLNCFWAEIVSGDLTLKEHQDAKWLAKNELDSVEWLPADITLIEQIKQYL